MLRTQLFTLGHGTAGEVDLAALIRAHGVRAVVDVRSVPKSRAHPHVWADRMAQWVPDLSGATYEWRKGLGGFRPTRAESPNVGLRHPAFRGYADYMQTPEFLSELQRLVRDAALAQTTIMCSETLWWRCHRRLIADAAMLLHGVEVRHIMHSGPPRPHIVTEGAHVLSDGVLQYDAPADA
jgi:uncharacterized protein (DUF488 family)